MSKKYPDIVPISHDLTSKIARELHSIAERNPEISPELNVVMKDYLTLISMVNKTIDSCGAAISSTEEKLSKINDKIDKKSAESASAYESAEERLSKIHAKIDKKSAETEFSYEFLDALESVLNDAGVPLSAVHTQK